jgi:3-(3-hydroxy-phenyl)propionate hydroxylase
MIDAPLAGPAGERVYLSDVRKPLAGFALVRLGNGAEIEAAHCRTIRIGDGRPLYDPSGTFAKRYDASEGSAYLLRPDGYVAARFRSPTPAAVAAAVARATGQAAAVP